MSSNGRSSGSTVRDVSRIVVGILLVVLILYLLFSNDFGLFRSADEPEPTESVETDPIGTESSSLDAETAELSADDTDAPAGTEEDRISQEQTSPQEVDPTSETSADEDTLPSAVGDASETAVTDDGTQDRMPQDSEDTKPAAVPEDKDEPAETALTEPDAPAEATDSEGPAEAPSPESDAGTQAGMPQDSEDAEPAAVPEDKDEPAETALTEPDAPGEATDSEGPEKTPTPETDADGTQDRMPQDSEDTKPAAAPEDKDEPAETALPEPDAPGEAADSEGPKETPTPETDADGTQDRMPQDSEDAEPAAVPEDKDEPAETALTEPGADAKAVDGENAGEAQTTGSNDTVQRSDTDLQANADQASLESTGESDISGMGEHAASDADVAPGEQAEASGELQVARLQSPGTELAPEPPLIRPPTFDIVRVDANGIAVIAGRTSPNHPVIAIVDSKDVGQERSDSRGQFTFILGLQLAQAPVEFQLATVAPDWTRVYSTSTVIVVPGLTGPSRQPQKDQQDGGQPNLINLRDGMAASLFAAPGEQQGVDLITYNESGEVFLSGRGQPNGTITVTLGGAVTPIVARIGETGTWTADLSSVPRGTYTVGTVERDASGRIVRTSSMPFRKEDAQFVRNTLDALRRTSSERSSDVADDEIAKLVTVQKGNTLWGISRKNYGLGRLYVRIFHANINQIRDPDLIYPGQIFLIPGVVDPSDN